MWMLISRKYFHCINLPLIAAIFIIGYTSHSYFEMACASCGALFWLVGLRLSFVLGKEESIQKRQCRPIGFFVLLPTLGIICVGILMLFRDGFGVSDQGEYYVTWLSCALFVCLLIQMLVTRKDKTTASRFARQLALAALCVPLSLIISLTLRVTSADDAVALGSMSTIVFGVVSLLIAANMIMISNCGYKSTVDSIKAIRDLQKKHKLVFTRVSIAKDTFSVIVKAVISVVALSFFMFVNALYSAGMGVVKFYAIKMHKQEIAEQIVTYRNVGIVISCTNICYVLYSVRLFYGGSSGVYDMNVALTIALYTFVEFGINIREAFRLRKSKELTAKALMAISFSSTLLCFVLTQTAIMSFASEGDNSSANALSGIFFGSLAVLCGLAVVVDSFRQKKSFVK